MNVNLHDTRDLDIQARERSYFHAGILLALHFSTTHSLYDAPPFSRRSPTLPHGTGLTRATVIAVSVVATAMEVDIATHFHLGVETEHDDFGDHVDYVFSGGHLGNAFDLDATAEANPYWDNEDVYEAAYELLILRHWTAVSAIAEALVVDPNLAADLATIESMLRVTGPSVWAASSSAFTEGKHDDDNCPDCA